jgi:hypothetical protein
VSESRGGNRVRVIDRRRFTAEGEMRAPESAPVAETRPEAQAAPAAAPAEPGPVAARTPEHAAAAPQTTLDQAPGGETEPVASGALPSGPGIGDIVDLLAQQAMAFLSGQVPGRGRDPATARYFIDLLGVLKEKTAGRLTLEETNFLDDVLYQLRSLFVAATR